jgi:hypothetical protein
LGVLIAFFCLTAGLQKVNTQLAAERPYLAASK